jgi:hypothetical protein
MAARSKARTVFETLGSRVRILLKARVCVSVFLCYVVLSCVGRGLASG